MMSSSSSAVKIQLESEGLPYADCPLTALPVPYTGLGSLHVHKLASLSNRCFLLQTAILQFLVQCLVQSWAYHMSV